MVLRDAAHEGPALLPRLLRRRREGGETRRARHPLHVQARTEPRIAPHPRTTGGSTQALVGKAGIRKDLARTAARLGRLSRRRRGCRPPRHPAAGSRLLGTRSSRQRRARQLRHGDLRLLPRRHRRVGGLQGRRVRLPARELLEGLGHRLRLPRHAGGPGKEGGDPAFASRRYAGLRIQRAAAALRRSPCARGARPRLRLRVVQPDALLRAVQADEELLRQLGTRRGGSPGAGRVGGARTAARQGARRSLHHRLRAAGHRWLRE